MIGFGVTDCTLTAATGLSADGSVIVGNGMNQSWEEGWRAVVPRE
ncbi:MAG: hypothetical protein AB7N71_09220 [Phycisphaerae bacterium]